MRTPILFIPGFSATELREPGGRLIYPPSIETLADPKRKARLIRRLLDSSALVPGEPIRDVFFGLAKQAQSLYDVLKLYGYSTSNPEEFIAVGWDWRKAIDDEDVIRDLDVALISLARRGKVLAIVHSTGGLLLRRYLELHPHRAASIGQILGFGVPWAGTVTAFRYISKGAKFGFMSASLTPTETRTVMQHAQAAYDLLPPPGMANAPATDAPPSLVFENGVAVLPCAAVSWIRAADAAVVQPMAGHAMRLVRLPEIELPGHVTPPITNVVGFGAPTDVKAIIRGPGKVDFEASDEGDGTVPLVSAQWIRGAGVRTFHVPIGVYPTAGIPSYHSQLWDAPPLLEIFDQILLGTPPAPYVAAAIDTDDASAGGARGLRIRIAAAAANGAPLPSLGVTFEGLRQRVKRSLENRVRATVELPKSILPPYMGSPFVRFEAILKWGSGSAAETRELPLIYRR